MKHYPVSLRDSHVLDVGTGNGALLFKLAKKGYTNLKGIDYSEYSIRLVKKI
jgi:2-polyprenyl-3-methyl-5-hydroxy-6-metoxy-1,4-benzoquinol methylase